MHSSWQIHVKIKIHVLSYLTTNLYYAKKKYIYSTYLILYKYFKFKYLFITIQSIWYVVIDKNDKEIGERW